MTFKQPLSSAHDYPTEEEKEMLKELFYTIEHLCLNNKASVGYYPKVKAIYDKLKEELDSE
jgi:hypothetical protein